jgi:hypothetical protein
MGPNNREVPSRSRGCENPMFSGGVLDIFWTTYFSMKLYDDEP